MKSATILSIAGVAVIMLVIGTALGSIAFPMTKIETTTILGVGSTSRGDGTNPVDCQVLPPRYSCNTEGEVLLARNDSKYSLPNVSDQEFLVVTNATTVFYGCFTSSANVTVQLIAGSSVGATPVDSFSGVNGCFAWTAPALPPNNIQTYSLWLLNHNSTNGRPPVIVIVTQPFVVRTA
jgi:hypothetical protein